MPRLWQSLFYLLGYERHQICLEGTNKLFWKYAKRVLDEKFIERLVNYTPYGIKDQKFY